MLLFLILCCMESRPCSSFQQPLLVFAKQCKLPFTTNSQAGSWGHQMGDLTEADGRSVQTWQVWSTRRSTRCSQHTASPMTLTCRSSGLCTSWASSPTRSPSTANPTRAPGTGAPTRPLPLHLHLLIVLSDLNWVSYMDNTACMLRMAVSGRQHVT